jgi:hypothetical protein
MPLFSVQVQQMAFGAGTKGSVSVITLAGIREQHVLICVVFRKADRLASDDVINPN